MELSERKDPIFKSKRRHGLKEIERKWKPREEKGKEMVRALQHKMK
jgi:hypothetical protein